MPDRPLTRFSGMAVAFAAVGGWELFIASGLLNYSYLPAPHQILYAIRSLVSRRRTRPRCRAHAGRSAGGGRDRVDGRGGGGLGAGLVPNAHRWVMASVDFARTIPAVALVPVAVLTFGPIHRRASAGCLRGLRGRPC